MADALKSTSITTLDATPVLGINTGEGAPASQKVLDDYVTPTTGGLGSTASLYKMLRLPSKAILKKLTLFADGALDSNVSPTLALDVGAYYSDSTVDGTASANQGVLISANCFAAAIAYGAATNINGVDATAAYAVANRLVPLWKGLGLSSDPGGMIDVVIAIHTIAATAVSKNVMLKADFSV